MKGKIWLFLMFVVLIASNHEGWAQGKIEKFGLTQGFPSDYARELLFQRNKGLWVSFNAQVGIGGAGIAFFKELPPKLYCHQDSGLKSLLVRCLATDSYGNIYAGTEKGLHIFDGESKFQPIGPDIPISFLKLVQGDVFFAMGSFKNENPVILRIQNKKIKAVKGKTKIFRPIALFVVPGGGTMVVGTYGIAFSDGRKVISKSLGKTPLWKPAIKDPDGPVPEVVLFAACQANSGDVYLIGHTRKLVRYREGKFSELAAGHFSGLCGEKNGEGAFASDFDGNVFHWNGKTFNKIFSNPEGRIGRMFADSSGVLWVEQEYSKKPHEILCLAPPSYNQVSCRFSLGHGTALSPGILGFEEHASGSVWISTNEGFWLLEK